MSDTALEYFDLNSLLAGVLASWIILSPVMTKASYFLEPFFLLSSPPDAELSTSPFLSWSLPLLFSASSLLLCLCLDPSPPSSADAVLSILSGEKLHPKVGICCCFGGDPLVPTPPLALFGNGILLPPEDDKSGADALEGEHTGVASASSRSPSSSPSARWSVDLEAEWRRGEDDMAGTFLGGDAWRTGLVRDGVEAAEWEFDLLPLPSEEGK